MTVRLRDCARRACRNEVRTCQSNSGAANPIRASRSVRRPIMAREASASVSARERTSSTTVFTIPPYDVSIEIDHELVWRRERIRRLLRAKVPVIASASLIVIPQHTLPGDDIGEPVLESMRRRRYRLMKPSMGACCRLRGRFRGQHGDGGLSVLASARLS